MLAEAEDGLDDGLLELEEVAELQGLVASVVDSGGAAAGAVLPRLKQILTRYQEQPQLLDGALESLVAPLAALLQARAASAAAAAAACDDGAGGAGDIAAVARICRLLHVFVTVRGAKTVVRFLPHEAADLERALGALDAIRQAAAAAAAAPAAAGGTITTITSSSGAVDADANDEESGAGSAGGALAAWEAQAVLLLWLSMLVLTPFDLRTVDSAAENDSGSHGPPSITPLAARILDTCQGYLDHPGPAREMAALLLARLATRPDMGAALAAFLAWQARALAAADPARLQFLLPGVLQALALVFKVGQRPALLPHAPRVWEQLSEMWDAADAAAGGGGSGGGNSSVGACLAGSSLARRLAVKLAQRVGLALLAPRRARWRYARALPALLGGGSGGGSSTGPSTTEDVGGGCELDDAEDNGDNEEPDDLADEVEGVLGALLAGLRDRDTPVRWAAAKGVARLAGRLPLDLAGDVVDGVMALFGPSEGDAAWHGGCLALAELARRSLLLPARLPAAARVVAAALRYDARRGPHSVGAHVRDAAAYVAWALARAYEPRVLLDGSGGGGVMAELAGPLLAAATYDREVNVRRAAASAFQEAVGRLGGALPDGLDLLAGVDCGSVGNAAGAALVAAPHVARFKQHRGALLGHLLELKLRHWDAGARGLGARALAALVDAAGAPFVAARALPALLGRAADADGTLEARLGALVGLGELLPALAAAGVTDLDAAAAAGDGDDAESRAKSGAPSLSARVASVLPDLARARLYRGKGGEPTREAAARFAAGLACAAGGWHVAADGRSGGSSPSSRPSSRAEEGGSGDGTGTGSADNAPAAAAPPHAGARGGRSFGPLLLRPSGAARLMLALGPEYHEAALALIEDCLTHPLAGTRAAGAGALAAYTRAHASGADAAAANSAAAGARALVDRCLARLTDANFFHRRGAAQALGALPARMLLLAPPGAAGATVVVAALARAADAAALPSDLADVEARVAALDALGALAAELSSPDECCSSGGREAAASLAEAATTGLPPLPPPPRGLVTRLITPALLAATRDYATDSRGDVGSWARAAAMDALSVAAPLALAEGDCDGDGDDDGGAAGTGQEQQQQQQQVSKQQQVASGVTEDGTGQPDQRCSTAAPRMAAGNEPLPVAVMGALLRVSVERIARLREAAVAHARALLARPRFRAAVPFASAVEAALPEDAADAAGVASLAAIDRLAGLLRLRPYTPHILEGLVQSIGGVDAALSKAAADALLAQIEEGGDEGDEADATEPLRARVAAELAALWGRERRAGSGRLSVALMRAAHLLVTGGDAAADLVPAPAESPDLAPSNGGPIAAPPAAVPFAAAALTLARLDLRGCGDVPRLLEGARLITALAGCGTGGDGGGDGSGNSGATTAYAALQSAMALLVGRYPRVRRAVAEGLYMSLLAAGGDDNGDEESEGSGDNDGSVAVVAAGGGKAAAAPPRAWRPPPAEDLERALDLLLQGSNWDAALDAARAARDELAALLRVEVRARAAGAGGPEAGKRGGAAAAGAAKSAAAAVPPAAAFSYQSLLDDAARGGGY